MVSRFGGDEFVVLLNDVSAVADLAPRVERILAVLARPMLISGHEIAVSAAAGTAVSLTGYDSADDVLRDADTAMYRAKSLGNGSSQLFDHSMHANAMTRLQTEVDLRQALAEAQFELYFQPILDLTTRRPVALEALLRWNHPTRGLLPPAEFLPVAEAAGLILPIGRWTVREACRRVRQWRLAFPDDDLAVCVNLSRRQFWDPDLRETLRQALDDPAVPPSALVLELTEGVLMDKPEAAVAVLRRLHGDGFSLHIDDFGSGYSSLAALHTLPIDALKIDSSFIADLNQDTCSRELVSIMIAMGRTLGVAVIAEGVETDAQAATLAEIGCPLVQGYLFSRPVPAAQVPGLLTPDQVTSTLAG